MTGRHLPPLRRTRRRMNQHHQVWNNRRPRDLTFPSFWSKLLARHCEQIKGSDKPLCNVIGSAREKMSARIFYSAFVWESIITSFILKDLFYTVSRDAQRERENLLIRLKRPNAPNLLLSPSSNGNWRPPNKEISGLTSLILLPLFGDEVGFVGKGAQGGQDSAGFLKKDFRCCLRLLLLFTIYEYGDLNIQCRSKNCYMCSIHVRPLSTADLVAGLSFFHQARTSTRELAFVSRLPDNGGPKKRERIPFFVCFFALVALCKATFQHPVSSASLTL